MITITEDNCFGEACSIKFKQTFFYQLIMLYRPFEKRLNIQLNKHHLFRGQWTILYYLYHFGPATLVEISDYQGVEKPTVTRTFAGLEELQYVEQIAGKDKRQKLMQLTDRGREIYELVRVDIDELEQEILDGITEEELLQAVQVMQKIRNNVRK